MTTTKKKIHRQVSVRGSTYERVRAAARARGIPVSKLVEEALGLNDPLWDAIDDRAARGVDPASTQG